LIVYKISNILFTDRQVVKGCINALLIAFIIAGANGLTEHLLMSTAKPGNRYDENFKRTLVNPYQSDDKLQATLCKKYGVLITVDRTKESLMSTS